MKQTDHVEPRIEVKFNGEQLTLNLVNVTPQQVMDAATGLEKAAMKLLRREPLGPEIK